MPADTSKHTSSRRTQRKITEEELKDIELKRIRGELSCAECRRLKLRCDKKVPCSSCTRRGCESICPCGILSAGQGTRFILADTEQLHRKIAEMSHRIRHLEDALAILQAAVSSERHPLLTDDLLKIKFGAEALGRAQSKAVKTEEDETTRQSIDALGTLTLDDSGDMKFFGRSAGSETLLMVGEEWDAPSIEDGDPEVPLPPELEKLSSLFPFTTKRRTNTACLEMLESFLPPYERAWALCESFIDHATYFFRPLKRDELMDHLLPSVFNTASGRQLRSGAADSPGSVDESQSEAEVASLDSATPHLLATLFFIFALGALLDINNPPYNQEAERYYDLGRAALSLRPVFDSPQIATVQAVGLMATYHSLAGKKYSRDSAWSLMSLAAKLAQSIGLHRDSARWNLDPTTVQRRRSLFWDIFAADVSHSLALGRPPAIHLSYVDCEFPVDEEATLSDSQEVQFGFWRMKHTFARDIFMAVAETTLIAKSPSYNMVLDLDRKVREMSFPATFKPYVRLEDGEKEYYSSSLSLRGFYASQHRTLNTAMLYLHRSFFAQAMLDHPTNPLLSPFAPSFLTAYRCASIIIKATAHQFDRCAEMAMRLWFLLYHTFSAAVIVGTVVTYSPNSTMASSALLDLGLAVELFDKAAVKSRRAQIALAVLRKLKDKAVRAYTQYCSATLPTQINSGNSSPASLFNMPSNFVSPVQDDAGDELAIFGGQKRVLTKKVRHSSSRSSPQTGIPDSPSPPSTGCQTSSPLVLNAEPLFTAAPLPPDVHPSLMEYLGQGNMFTMESSFQHDATRPDTDLAPSQRSPPAEPNKLPAVNRGGVGEMYQSFMSYLANRSIINAPPSNVPASMESIYNQHQAALWATDTGRHKSSDPAAWLQTVQSPTSGIVQVEPRSSSALNTTSANPLHVIPETGVPGIFAGYSHDISPYDNSYAPNQALNQSLPPIGVSLPVNPTEEMVEMGLTTESGMDAGWLSFMRECGILEGGQSYTGFT